MAEEFIAWGASHPEEIVLFVSAGGAVLTMIGLALFSEWRKARKTLNTHTMSEAEYVQLNNKRIGN